MKKIIFRFFALQLYIAMQSYILSNLTCQIAMQSYMLTKDNNFFQYGAPACHIEKSYYRSFRLGFLSFYAL